MANIKIQHCCIILNFILYLKASALLLDVSVELKHFVRGRRNSPASQDGSIFFNSAGKKLKTKNNIEIKECTHKMYV